MKRKIPNKKFEQAIKMMIEGYGYEDAAVSIGIDGKELRERVQQWKKWTQGRKTKYSYFIDGIKKNYQRERSQKVIEATSGGVS